MAFTDTKASTDRKHTYTVVAVNTAGLHSTKAAAGE
jgi:hypothetical protein